MTDETRAQTPDEPFWARARKPEYQAERWPSQRISDCGLFKMDEKGRVTAHRSLPNGEHVIRFDGEPIRNNDGGIVRIVVS